MKRLAALAVLLAAAAFSGGVGRSQATFVASSDQANQTFGASAVFNGVAVSLSDPGTPLRSTVPLSATASSDRPLVSVTFQRSPAGAGTWTTICAPTAAPYTCSWNTGGVADGLYDLRATALDASGYSRTSTVASRRVDNTAPATTLTVPAAPLTGTRTVSATASDAATGIASVAFEARPSSGGSWTAICTDTVAPYACSWNTASGADGDWDVRATATDGAGNTATSSVTGRRVDNTAPSVSVVDDGTPRRGTTTIATTLADGAGSGVASVLYQFRTSGGGAWTDVCTLSSAPFTCGVDTTAVPDGLYDVRAIATDGVGLSTTSATVTIRIDNTAPSAASMTTPTGPISGSITLNGTGADAVGMGSMRFEVRTAGGGTWQTACTDVTPPSPFSCSWNSATVADGSYEFRAVAIDLAGNTRNSSTTSSRIVDNNGPVVSVTGPAQARGTTTVTTSVSDASGIQNVVIRHRAAGGGAYTTICTDSSGPTYSCPWNVSALTDGAYELIAVATDTLGRSTTSAVYATAVNNTGPTGTDIQGTNGGVNDRLDAGDTVRFTYSTTMAPASILAGWSGSSTAIRVRVAENGSADTMTFYDASNTTPLTLLAAGASLGLRANYVSQASVFNATIVRSGSLVTVTIGSLISGSVRSSTSGNNPMTWQTNAAATDATGRPVYATTVTESGSDDTDF
jgi:hypothetical protein